MKPPLSFKRKLLQQAQEDKLQRERIRSSSIKMEARSPVLKDVSSNKPSPLPPSPPLDELSAMDMSGGPAVDIKPREPTPAKEPTPSPIVDVDMGDTQATSPRPPEPKIEEMPDALAQEPSLETSDPPLQPPAPPWTPSTPAPEASTKPAEFHVEMPTKPDLANITGTVPMVTPGSISNVLTGTTIAQSPSSATIGSPFSPAVNNAVNPTPARKKLSLSDYTSRRAKLAQTHSNSTPPFGQSQSTSSPTLSTASLPNTNSPPRRSVEPALPPLAEEPNATELIPVATVTTASTST